MFQEKTNTELEPASIIVDDAPALDITSTYFWKDYNDNWHTVEVIDCEPKGWGFCTIKWQSMGEWHTRPVPYTSVFDLDAYLDMQADYGQFEAADNDDDYDNWKDERALHRWAHGD